MERKKTFTIIAIGALALLFIFGGVAYKTVLAQTPTPATPAAPSTSPSQKGGMDRGLRGVDGGISDQDLATALGITTDKLSAAIQSATAEALKEAVSKGLITQAQADQMSAKGSGRFAFGIGKEGWLSANGIDYNALLAKALGISSDALKTAEQKAYSDKIDAAVKAGTLTQAQADLMKGRYALENSSTFLSNLQSAFQAAVNQAVKDGLITQAQADAILKNSTTNGMRGGWFGLDGGMKGGFGGRGGMGHPGGKMNPNGQKSSPNGSATPAPTNPF